MELSDTERRQRVERVLAHLIRNCEVTATEVEEAVTSAVTMRLGEMVTLTGPDPNAETLRRNFVQVQSQRIWGKL